MLGYSIIKPQDAAQFWLLIHLLLGCLTDSAHSEGEQTCLFCQLELINVARKLIKYPFLCLFFRPTGSSSMTSKQETDSDTHDPPSVPLISHAKHSEKKVMVNSASQSTSPPPRRDSLDNGGTPGEASSPPPAPRQILKRSTTRSSSSSFSESLDPALDPSSLPPPDPWLESGNGSSSSLPQFGGGGTLCRRDGHWFLKLLQAETARMEGWCQQMEQETKDNQLSEEGKATGSKVAPLLRPEAEPPAFCPQQLSSDIPSTEGLGH